MEGKLKIALIFACLAVCLAEETISEELKEKADETVDETKLTYAKGSLCRYCDYCKFCTLCDDDCPCESSAEKPNCHMCKYCKYCYLCKVCDSICSPGGYVDTITAAIVNNLPGFGSEDTEQIDKDIKGAKTWIEKKSKEFDEQTKVTDKVKTAKDTVKDKVKDVKETVKDKVKDAKEKVQEKYEDAKDEL